MLADWIVSRANPNFARATVNRIWHEYFEAGIVEPFDDFRSTNMPTNRELLDHLEAGDSINQFLDGFPSVSREQVIAYLEEAIDRAKDAAE